MVSTFAARVLLLLLECWTKPANPPPLHAPPDQAPWLKRSNIFFPFLALRRRTS